MITDEQKRLENRKEKEKMTKKKEVCGGGKHLHSGFQQEGNWEQLERTKTLKWAN